MLPLFNGNFFLPAEQSHDSERSEEEKRTSINEKVYLFVLLVSGAVYCEAAVMLNISGFIENVLNSGIFFF